MKGANSILIGKKQNIILKKYFSSCCRNEGSCLLYLILQNECENFIIRDGFTSSGNSYKNKAIGIFSKGMKEWETYVAWLLKQGDDSIGRTLLLPPTSSCHVHTVPSSAALANRCPQWSNCNADIDARAYGGGTFAAGRTP